MSNFRGTSWNRYSTLCMHNELEPFISGRVQWDKFLSTLLKPHDSQLCREESQSVWQHGIKGLRDSHHATETILQTHVYHCWQWSFINMCWGQDTIPDITVAFITTYMVQYLACIDSEEVWSHICYSLCTWHQFCYSFLLTVRYREELRHFQEYLF